MKGTLQFFVTLALVLIVIAVAGRIPGVRSVDAFTDQHRRPLVAAGVGLMILGVLSWLGGVIYRTLKSGIPLRHEEVEEMMSGRYRGRTFSRYRFWGQTWGKGFEDGFSFAEAKQATKDRWWWKDPRWRIRFLISAGALATGLGLFALIGTLAPVSVKLVLAGAMLYALVRVTRALWRA